MTFFYKIKNNKNWVLSFISSHLGRFWLVSEITTESPNLSSQELVILMLYKALQRFISLINLLPLPDSFVDIWREWWTGDIFAFSCCDIESSTFINHFASWNCHNWDSMADHSFKYIEVIGLVMCLCRYRPVFVKQNNTENYNDPCIFLHYNILRNL